MIHPATVPGMPRPVLIALVGVDGSGKTTQAKELVRRLTAQGAPARYFENGGGRPLWNRLAHALGRSDGVDLFGRTLHAALEATLRGVGMARTLAWSWLTGRTAVLDRWSYCQYVVMRARGDRGERLVRAAYRFVPRPTLVCFLSTSPERARQRVLARGIDTEELSYLRDLDAAYRTLPEFERFVVVDGDDGPAEVAAALDRLVRRLITPAGRN